MELTEYRNIYLNEESHFFYVSTHELIIRLIRKGVHKSEGLDILDVGCGTGGLAKKMEKFGSVSGIDGSEEAIKFCRKRGVNVIKASVDKMPFNDNSFDLITCVDVLYHKGVNDDVVALKEIKRILMKDGWLIIRVPAFNFLLSAHDRHVHTARRYTANELERKINQAGLSAKQISYVHSPIFILGLLRTLAERFHPNKQVSAVSKVNRFLNTALIFILNIEGRMIENGLRLPLGQGVIAVAKKK